MKSYEKYIAPILLVGALTSACSDNASPSWESDTASITIEASSSPIANARLEKAATIAGKIINEFDCEGNFTIAAGEFAPNPTLSGEELNAGFTDALTGTITFNNLVIEKASAEQLENVVIHETAHLCAGPERKLSTPIDSGSGMTLNYVIGFGLSTDKSSAATLHTFNHLEEGFATFVGNTFAKDFKSDTDYYIFVSDRFKQLLAFGEMSLEQAQAYHAKSDLEGFFAALLGKKVADLTNADSLQILGGFDPANS